MSEPLSFVASQVRRVCRNLLVWNGVVVALIALAVLALASYWTWFWRGPRLADDAFILDAAKGPPSSVIAYIEMRERKLLTTGFVEQATQNDVVYSTSPYYFVGIGDKLLLVKATAQTNGKKLIGPLETIDIKSDRDAVSAMVAKNPGLRGRMLPVMLNAAAAFNVFGYVFLALVAPILLICAYNVFRALLGQRDPPLHPVMRALARYGPPREVAREIDADLADEDVLTFGKALMSETWLVRPTLFRIVVCRIDDIVWAYHVRVAGDHVASLALRNGRMFGIPLQRNVPELLAALAARVPWAHQGFSMELAKKWRKQRAEFIAEVDARRKT
jgi:hypothetical protein